MNDVQITNNNSFLTKKTVPNIIINKSPDQENDDIIKQLSQISPSEDKSFESSLLLTKNIPKFFDYKSDDNLFSKDSNIPQNEDNSLINNKHLILKKKLKYLCSLIQSSNINIRQYDDLKLFNKYLNNSNLIQNHHEPINVLFDIISELIFYIQKELKNSDILMREIKRLKNSRNDNDKLIYKLKNTIKEKDQEINFLRVLRKEKEEKNKYNSNEISSSKQENKEIYNSKLNTSRAPSNKDEQNNKKIFSKFNKFTSFNKEKKKIKNRSPNNEANSITNLGSIHSLNNLIKLNNSYDDSKCNLKKGLTKQNENFDFYNNMSTYKTINYNNVKNCKNYASPTKITNQNLKNYKLKNNTINITKNEDNNNKKSNDKSLIHNMKNLLKEINDMLYIYNSTLDKIQINDILKNSKNNTIDDENIKSINAFLGKMDNKIKKMEYYMRINYTSKSKNKNKNSINKQLIHVNTSKWKFRKKAYIKKNEKDDKQSSSLNCHTFNEKSCISLNNEHIYHKKNIINVNDNNICFGYKNKYTIKIKDNS